MEPRDYYETLGVESKATRQQIRASFRKLAFQYHPDRNKDSPAAASRMKEINEAYAVLSDPDKRARYDTLRETLGASAQGRFRQDYSDSEIFRGSDISQIFEELSKVFGLRGFQDIFRESYGETYRSFQFRRPGVFGRIFVTSHPSWDSGGGPPPLRGPLGKLIRYGLRKAWGIELPEHGEDLEDPITISPTLAAKGGKIRYSSRRGQRDLIVAIPPALREGQRIRLRGMGRQGRAGGRSGDLYLKVHVRNALAQALRDLAKKVRSHITSKGR
jgi:DnaJ-class molecular chaperone